MSQTGTALERELVLEIGISDSKQREGLVAELLPMVGALASRITPSCLWQEIEEIRSAGTFGLMRALSTFNPKRGAAFKTHAHRCIESAIRDRIREFDYLPRSARDRTRVIAAAAERVQDRGEAVCEVSLAAELGQTLRKFRKFRAPTLRRRPVRLADLRGSEEEEWCEIAADPHSADPTKVCEARELRERLAMALKELPDRLQKVVTLYFVDELTLNEVGERLGVTETRAYQLLKNAKEQLAQKLGLD